MKHVLAFFLYAGILFGQEFRGTVQGSVTDPSNAAVVGAEVVLRNTESGIERKTTTDATGRYIFQFLPPATYSLVTRLQGFKTDQRDGIGVSVGDNIRIEVQLAIGQATETVTITGDVATVQTDSSSLGSTVRQEIIKSLPLKGHSSLFMFTLATGVVNNRYSEDTRPNDTITNVSYSSNGAPMASGDVAVDGVSNTVNVNRGVNISQWVPARFAVAEFKLENGTLAAEHGRSGGSIMSLVIKSGTNELHGDAYEFLRAAALDANLFYNNVRGVRLTRYNSNTYGASLGGPIWIPKLYNGKNRSFFFFNFEGSREGNGLSNVMNVPTAKMRTGDFSEISLPIYNPLSSRESNGVVTRDPFPGNIIPQASQDRVGRSLMAYWPESNVPSPDANRPYVQNYIYSGKWPRDYDAIVLKLDHQINAKNNMFIRLNQGEGRLVFNYRFDGIATSQRNRVKRPHLGVAISNTMLINERTTLDIRLGYARGTENNRPWSDGFDPTTLGLPQSYLNVVQSRAFPTVGVAEMEPLAGIPFIMDPGDTWSLQPAMTRQLSKHLVKFGGDFRLLRGNYFRNTHPSGSFSFGPNQTGGPRADTPAGGFALASMLVGFGSSGFIPFNNGVSIQNVFSGLYLQDDWRITRKLTLNLGVRYEYETPRTERYDRTVRGWGYGAQSPLQVPGLNLTGGLIYAGVNGQPRGLYNRDGNNFAPRIGFAYNFRKGMVVRGGYALSYIPVVGSVLSTGFSIDTPWVTSQDGGLTPLNRLSNPFPNGLIAPIGSSQGLGTLMGQGVAFIEPGDKYPRFHNWNLNIQKELPSQGVLEIAYVGSRGIGLIGNTENLNQLDPRYLSETTSLTQTVPNPFFGLLSGPIGGRTVQRQQLLRPYPQFTGVSRQNPAFGNSVYHSAQIQYEKRMAQGVSALVSYTISKNISDISNPQNAFNRQAERAVSDLDVPQRLSIAAAWELPIGRGQPFLKDLSRGADLLIGGWQLSTFSTFQAGFAMGFGVQGGTYPTGGVRPNVVGDPTDGVSGSHQSRLDRYFNTAAFAAPANFTLGNAAARIHTVRSPGMNNVNLTLAKDFKVTERVVMEFRASMFNLFNHPVFNGPNTTVGNASFGRVAGQANLSRQTEFGLRLTY